MKKYLSRIEVLMNLIESLSVVILKKKILSANLKPGRREYILEISDSFSKKEALIVFDVSLKTECRLETVSDKYFFELYLSGMQQLHLIRNELHSFFMNHRLLKEKCVEVAHKLVSNDNFSFIIATDEPSDFIVENYVSGRRINFRVIWGSKTELRVTGNQADFICNPFTQKHIIKTSVIKAFRA